MDAELVRLPTCGDMIRQGPVGYYVTGEHFMIWCTRPELCGVAFWGRLTMAELELLTYVYDHGEDTNIATPCDFVFDARRLDGLEAGVYEVLARDTASRVANLSRRLRRQAFIRNTGLLGAAVSGFYPVLDVQFESRVFTELAPACAWLEQPDDLADTLERLIAEAISGSLLLDRMRAWLATRIDTRTNIEIAGRWAGVSTRSLQRHLRDAGTTFKAELDRARLATAKHLLLETDLKIAAIASRVGGSSEANFISFFRRLVGVSPAEWRRQNRGENGVHPH
jgi:AraC-like DNA-binding protein